jgi:hypothetical protein
VGEDGLGRLTKQSHAWFNVNIRTHCKPLFNEANMLNLEAIYILNCLIYAKCNFNKNDTHEFNHNYNTRNKGNLRHGQCRYTVTFNSFIEQSKRLYNMLPFEIRCLDGKKFKNILTSYLLKLCPYNTQESIDSFK